MQNTTKAASALKEFGHKWDGPNCQNQRIPWIDILVLIDFVFIYICIDYIINLLHHIKLYCVKVLLIFMIGSVK